MKNLIFTISDSKFKEILEVCAKSIHKYNDIDICCISPRDVIVPSVFSFFTDNYDYKYTSRFKIGQWEKSYMYDNFLYIDPDILCLRNLDPIFNAINGSPDLMHSVLERKSLNDSYHFHRFSGLIFEDNKPAFNNGTFGFNKKILGVMDDFLLYVEENKHKAFCDQALFNEFFTIKNILSPTLSPYVYLANDSVYKDINPTDISKICLHHYLGGFESGNIKSKYKRMKADFGE